MGFIYADVELFNAYDLDQAHLNLISKDEVRALKIEDILVDTGAIMLVINETMQAHLQCRVLGREFAEMADGSQIECDIIGPVELRFKNRRAVCQALVLPGNSAPLLGALPLEEMDVLIDPLRQRLIVNPLYPDRPHLRLPSVRLLPANATGTTVL
jgi:predicted aspartyl protease